MLQFLMDLMGVDEFLPHSDLFNLVGDTLCQDSSTFQSVCSNILFLVAGYDSRNLNEVIFAMKATRNIYIKEFAQYPLDQLGWLLERIYKLQLNY